MPRLLRFTIMKAAASPIDGRHAAPGIIAARNLLDLDHLGAHVGQHQRAGRPRHDVGQIDHLEAGKRAHDVSPKLVIRPLIF